MSEENPVTVGTGKKNKDGLIGGKLVSVADHTRVMRQRKNVVATQAAPTPAPAPAKTAKTK